MRAPVKSDSPMVGAAHHTLEALRDANMLTPRHGVLVQLMLSLSQAIDHGNARGRASAVAMASRELRETLMMLDPPPADMDASADAVRRLTEFMAVLDRAAAAGTGPVVVVESDGR